MKMKKKKKKKMILYILHFPVLMALKSCYIFFISVWWLIDWCLINISFGKLVNGKFSNLKLNIFIVTGFTCSNKYMKQAVLINHSWISPMLQRRWELEFFFFSNGNWSPVYSQKWCIKVYFPQKRERLVK